MRLSTAFLSAGVALASGLIANSASGAVTAYSWLRAGESGIMADSSGANHPFNAAFSAGCAQGGGGLTAAIVTPTGVGGPLGGPGGPTSAFSTRWGFYGCGNSGMWIQGPNNSVPPPAQWSLPAVDWAMECWVLPQNDAGAGGNAGGQFMSTGSGQFGGLAGGARFFAQFNPEDGSITIRATRIGPGTNNDDIGDPVITDTTHWIHVAVVNDGGVTTFYVNGQPSGAPRTDVTPPSGVPYIGSGQDTGAAFDGYIDEARYSTFAPGAFLVTDLLTLPPGPSIISQPQSAVVWSGGPAPFEVRTAINADLTYQWKRDGTDLPGENSPELYLPSVGAGDDAKVFTVLLSSGGIDLTSASATLNVAPSQTANVDRYRSAVLAEASLIGYLPVDGSSGASVANVADVTRAGSLSLEAGYDGRTNRAFGERALRFKGDNEVTIANNPAYEFSDGSGTIEAIIYLQPGGSPTGLGTVGTILSMALDPSTTFYAIQASYDGTTLSYRSDTQTALSWQVPTSLVGRRAHIAFVFDAGNVTAYVDGESLGSKANAGFGGSPGLGINVGSAGRDFSAVIQNPWVGAVDELAFYANALSANTIAIHNSRYTFGTAAPPPVISSSPTGNKTLLAGGELFFRVAASGAAPLSYQWTLNGAPILGNASATTPNFRIPSSTLAMSGEYKVTVANEVGSVTSDPFTLSFSAPPDTYSATVLGDSPSAYWRLNETTGTTLKDSAGGYDGAVSGPVGLGVSGAPGVPDSGAQFSSAGGVKASVPYTPTLNPTTPFSVEFWAKPDVGGNRQGAVIGNQNRNAGRSGYAIYQGFNVNGWEAHIGFAETVNFIQGQTAPVAGRWDHVVLTWDGVSVGRIWVNGVDDTAAGSSVAGPNRPNLTVPLEFGTRFNGGVPFAGTIDEVVFYNHQLTEEQIRNHWSVAWVPPSITQQPPATMDALEATTVTLAATVVGYPNTYQWFKDGQPIEAATNPDGSQHYTGMTTPTLVITQSTPSDSGSYHLEVSNPINNVAGTPTVLTVAPDTTPPTIAYVTADSSMTRVRVRFDRWVTPETASVPGNYTFQGGITASSVALTSDPALVDVVTSPLTPGATYSVTVSGVRDQRFNSNLIGANSTPFRAYVLTPGVVAWDYYARLSGTGGAVDRLRNDPQFPNGVYSNGVLNSFSTVSLTGGDLNSNPAFGPQNLGSDYGMKVYGWVTPTVSGNYTFFLRSDDGSELWISPDADPNSPSKVLIAFETGCCDPFKEPTAEETSEPRPLTAGQSYYIEALNAEGGGGDYVQVAWRLEGDTTAAASLPPIPGTFLSAYAPVSPATLTATEGAGGQITITWVGPGTLEESSNLDVWTAVPGNPANTYTVTPAPGTVKFYRVIR